MVYRLHRCHFHCLHSSSSCAGEGEHFVTKCFNYKKYKYNILLLTCSLVFNDYFSGPNIGVPSLMWKLRSKKSPKQKSTHRGCSIFLLTRWPTRCWFYLLLVCGGLVHSGNKSNVCIAWLTKHQLILPTLHPPPNSIPHQMRWSW